MMFMGEPLVLMGSEYRLFHKTFPISVFFGQPLVAQYHTDQPLRYSPKCRTFSDKMAYREAIYDSPVAFRVEFTKDGVKTRQGFYSRK